MHPERQVIKGVDLHVKRGEIVGIAGLMGAGRTELAMSIFGRTYGQNISGEVYLHGRVIDTSIVKKAIAHGIAYVTEDRKGYGLVLDETIAWNTTLANLEGVADRGGSSTKVSGFKWLKHTAESSTSEARMFSPKP